MAPATKPPGEDSVFVTHWHPDQQRNNYAILVRWAFGLKRAGATLGYSKLSETEI